MNQDSLVSALPFAQRSHPNLKLFQKGSTNRLMTMCIPLAGNLTLIGAYAPTMTYPEEEKEQFYQVLKNIHSVPRNDKLLLLGDFNVRVGKNLRAWPDVIGPHGLGRENANGLLLLTLCSDEGLTITNTLFEQPEIHSHLDETSLTPLAPH
ncbi:hypothetical protein ACOMHN_008058 [Nucella lapillus]